MEDLNSNFEWSTEIIYKVNLKITFFRNLLTTIPAEDYTEEYAKFILRHEAAHAADDIMHQL